MLDEATIADARLAAGKVIAGLYGTGVKPLYRNWSPGDPPPSLVKIDLPHLSDGVIQPVVGHEPPFHRPDLSDPYACPVLIG